jgi:hypothetical protein
MQEPPRGVPQVSPIGEFSLIVIVAELTISAATTNVALLGLTL